MIQYESTGSIERLKEVVRNVASSSNINGILVLSCDDNHYTGDQISDIVGAVDIHIFGGIFPSIVYERNVFNKGYIVIGLSNVLTVAAIDELSNDSVDFEVLLDEKIPDIGDGKTMLVFVDGFSKRINAFIESLFIVFGLDINYIGGGAGSLSMKQKPCIFTNGGLMEDGAIIALLDIDSGVGVSHGWNILKGPFRVTESNHNTIKTLDWRPAFEVYHEVVSLHAERIFSSENFFEVSKAYPFGITRMNDELIVRDPIHVNPDQSLTCVGEVPEGSFVTILNGDESSLIKAAEKSVHLSVKAFPEEKPMEMLFLVDCISRVLFLEEKFKRELEKVHYFSLPMAGVCTLGEIANSGDEFLEFYNKTNVVAVLEKK